MLPTFSRRFLPLNRLASLRSRPSPESQFLLFEDTNFLGVRRRDVALVLVHRFTFSQQVLSENLDLLASHSQSCLSYSEILLHLRLLRALGLDAFGFSVDPILLGLDVLCGVLWAIEFPLVFFEFFLQNSFAPQQIRLFRRPGIPRSARREENMRALLSTACRGETSSGTPCRAPSSPRHAPRCYLLRPAQVGAFRQGQDTLLCLLLRPARADFAS